MFNANYHTHTTRCWHAVGTDREYIEAAIRAGFKVLGFADHAPYAFPNGFLSLIRMFPDTIEDYFTSLLKLKEEYKDQIEIKIGFEAEYYPDLFEDFLNRLAPYPCDYLILGQHSIFNEHDHNDTPPRGTMEYVNLYVNQVCEAMRTGYFTYLAHPDLAYCEGYPPEYYRSMEKIIECAIETDTPLEVNGHSLTHGKESRYPHTPFWEMVRGTNAKVVFGVDAHKPDALCLPGLAQKVDLLFEELGLIRTEPILRPMRSLRK